MAKATKSTVKKTTPEKGAATKVAVVGLGYVGLPLAVALARHHDVVGFDTDSGRIAQLGEGRDRTGEIAPGVLGECGAVFTGEADEIRGAEIFIITVPTPVDLDNRPDLGAVRAACATVGAVMGKGAIVVLESTVYPGVTEEVCRPDLEIASGLTCGVDFFLGYSPERINPGDTVHTVDRITKVVAGQTPEVAERLAAMYGAITEGGTFIARDIRTAEAAKVIENAQRDINIAFVNEITMIFNRLGLSVHDVLEAAGTKWNFLDFRPGLVGGHCIGIDPYYLAHLAQRRGHHPEIILAGRRINDGMGDYVAQCIDRELRGLGAGGGPTRVLVLGLTFKENVPDLRNSKVVDLVGGLRDRGYVVDIHDALADAAEAEAVYGVELLDDLGAASGYHCVVGAVPHDLYRGFTAKIFKRLLAPDGLVADVKGMWRGVPLPEGIGRWEL
ncbi:MAG: nucleotide sugar dehydrogenase [Alphaproteobacteria bacterium]